MSNFITETHVQSGHLELHDLPFSDNTEVRVIVIPKVDLKKASFPAIQSLTEPIKGNLSDDIHSERNGR